MENTISFSSKFNLQIVIRLGDIDDMVKILDNNKLQFTYEKNEVVRIGSFTIYGIDFKKANAIKLLLKQSMIKHY